MCVTAGGIEEAHPNLWKPWLLYYFTEASNLPLPCSRGHQGLDRDTADQRNWGIAVCVGASDVTQEYSFYASWTLLRISNKTENICCNYSNSLLVTCHGNRKQWHREHASQSCCCSSYSLSPVSDPSDTSLTPLNECHAKRSGHV